jgi:regulator of sigma E protease
MEPGEMSPYLQSAMISVYTRGTALMEDVASDCGCSDDDAFEALEELVEWGTIIGPKKTDEYNVYRVPERKPTRRQLRRIERARAQDQVYKDANAAAMQVRTLTEGQPAPIADPAAAFQAEYRQQYRALPTWKRIVILLAGPGVNLIFAMVAFVLIYSVLGFDYQNAAGEVSHVTVSPLRAIEAGFMYIGMVAQAVAGLFNPQTAAETVSNSTSVVGIAVMSKSAFEAGLTSVLSFTAMLSVSLGIMNMLPIPPLDGGRFVIEIYQRIRNKMISLRAMNYLSFAGIALFTVFFIVMMNQDIQRFIFNQW